MIDRDEACDRLEDENLTDWEADFVASIRDWHGSLTDAQAETLARLVKRRLGEDCDPTDFQ
jgi:hypothetical protein